MRKKLIRSIKENAGLKALSVALAGVLWFYAVGSRKEPIVVEAPIEFKASDNVLITSEAPTFARVTVLVPRGFERSIRGKNLKFKINLAPGLNTIYLKPEVLKLSRLYKVTKIEPERIELRTERVRSFKLRVVPDIVGRPLAGYKVMSITVAPAVIKAKGVESELKTRRIYTEPVDIEGRTETLEIEVPLVTYHLKFSKLERETVRVSVTIESEEDESEEWR